MYIYLQEAMQRAVSYITSPLSFSPFYPSFPSFLSLSLCLRNCVHRDLAARNILVHQDASGAMCAKVADFGLSRCVCEGGGGGGGVSVRVVRGEG